MLLDSQLPVEHVQPSLFTYGTHEKQKPCKKEPEPKLEHKIITAQIEEIYDLRELLGSGTFSIVRKAVHKKTKEEYAVKIINRTQNTCQAFTSALESELKIMREVEHGNIVKFHDVYQDDSNLYLLMELLRGGDLIEKVNQNGRYCENEVIRLVKQILLGTDYLHRSGVVHRDLKLQNLVFSDSKKIKIIDFGLSKLVSEKLDRVAGGTMQYAAPELLTDQLLSSEDIFKCDVWSIGVITYVLLCGHEPFPNNSRMAFRIKNGIFGFDSPEWKDVSDSAKSFISALMKVEPKARPSVSQCLEHEWLKS